MKTITVSEAQSLCIFPVKPGHYVALYQEPGHSRMLSIGGEESADDALWMGLGAASLSGLTEGSVSVYLCVEDESCK